MRINNNMMTLNGDKQLGVWNKVESKSIHRSSLRVEHNKRIDDIVELSIPGRGRSQGKINKSSSKINSRPQLTIPIRKRNTAGLIITDLRISSESDLEGEVSQVDKAIITVSNEKAALGTSENRLGHNTRSIDNPPKTLEFTGPRSENMDKVKEIMEKVRENMLKQAPAAVVAQSNHQGQGVLKLLG